jgi:hypothetical protein
MKLRFRANSLRLRLNQREVAELAAGKRLEERVEFPDGARFSYVFEACAGPAEVSFQAGALRILAPSAQVADWASGAELGLYFELPARDRLLRIAIEKDLACVDGPPEEYDPEAFPRTVASNC